jgi:hypothetical protein
LFAVFAGGSVVFREHFVSKWRKAHQLEVHGVGAGLRALFSVRSDDGVELLSAPGTAQIMIEVPDGDQKES